MPEVPRRELFMVGPILARTAGPNLTLVADPEGPDKVGGSSTFEPLLVLQHSGVQDLLALTQACVVGKRSAPPEAQIGRSLRSASGERVGGLEAVALALEGEGRIRCQNMLDVLPAESLNDGDYVFEAVLEKRDGEPVTSERVRFAVDRGRPRAPETP